MSNAFYANNYKGTKVEKGEMVDAKLDVPSIEEVVQITQEPIQQAAVQEEVHEAQDQNHNPAPQDEETVAQAQNPVTVQTDREINFRQLREQKERAERERDELMRQIQAQQKPQVQEEPEEDLGFVDDDFVEGKHLKKYAQEIKRLKKDLQEYKQQTTVQTIEARIKAQYPDFDKVVTNETIESLRYAYPELASTISSSSDLYSNAISAYTMIKKLGIVKEADPSILADRERVLKNSTKPKTVSSIAPQKQESPLSNANAFANGLTPELQKQLWKEMQELRKKG